jgi:chromosomal replication initiator protein
VHAFKAEDFMNRYVQAIRQGLFYAFRDRLRVGAALVIDELEDMLARPSTFEELTHAIGYYVENGWPVLMAMERRHPDHKYIEAYVRWFREGIVVDVRPPSMQQRMVAIRQALGRRRMPLRVMSSLACEAGSIPLARSAALNALFRSRYERRR